MQPCIPLQHLPHLFIPCLSGHLGGEGQCHHVEEKEQKWVSWDAMVCSSHCTGRAEKIFGGIW